MPNSAGRVSLILRPYNHHTLPLYRQLFWEFSPSPPLTDLRLWVGELGLSRKEGSTVATTYVCVETEEEVLYRVPADAVKQLADAAGCPEAETVIRCRAPWIPAQARADLWAACRDSQR